MFSARCYGEAPKTPAVATGQPAPAAVATSSPAPRPTPAASPAPASKQASAPAPNQAPAPARPTSSTGQTATTGQAATGKPALGIDDIKQFQAGSSTVGESSAQLKEKSQKLFNSLRVIQDRLEGETAASGLVNHCDNAESAYDACEDALTPYIRLFERFSPTTKWIAHHNELVKRIFATMEKNPEQCRALLHELQGQLTPLVDLKSNLIKLEHQVGPLPADAPLFLARYNLANRLEIVDGFRRAIERRIYLWALACNYYDVRNRGGLVPPKPIAAEDVARLRAMSEDVRSYFGTTRTGQAWRSGFEIDALIDDLTRLERSCKSKPKFRPIASDSTVPGSGNAPSDPNQELREETKRFYDRVNSICYKVYSTPMSRQQKDVFTREPIAGWVQTLSQFYCDQADADDLLWAFEQYERTSGADAGRLLLQIAYQMKSSASEAARAFGDGINVIYDNPNAKIYVSEVLINRLLPIRDPEFDVVQETILNNPIVGRRRTDTQVFIDLLPDPSRLTMNLHIEGKMVATTSSEVFPAKVFNESYAQYSGLKQIEWKDNHIVYSPANVTVDANSQLSGVQTEVDFVPLIGDLVREVAKGQYELQQREIQKETRRRVETQARARIDNEANERFDAANLRLSNIFFRRLDRLGLSLATQNSKTTDDWLLASLRLGTSLSLGSQSTEPPTLSGAFADLKVHESTINVFISRLGLEGRTLTPNELVNHIVTRLELRSRPPVDTGSARLAFTFAENDPVILRFFEDRVYLELAFETIALNNSEWHDIVVRVSYRPETTLKGQTFLVRDGIVSLEGPLGIRAQVPLRTIFSKVFPTEKEFYLEPPIFRTDERFTGLGIGLCRISRGWFGMSVIRK